VPCDQKEKVTSVSNWMSTDAYIELRNRTYGSHMRTASRADTKATKHAILDALNERCTGLGAK
jgi:hypothetical protein